jgi:hypothetical protein
MRWIAVTAALTGSLLLAGVSLTFAADTTVACPLLTQAQIGAVFGGTVGAGAPIYLPTSCQWAGQQGKRVTLTINQTRAGKSPVDQFNDGKARGLPGVTREPVSGIGDDAYYVYFTGQNRAGCGVMVKKGTSVFEIRVYGFDLSQAKTVAKTLAQDAAGKF